MVEFKNIIRSYYYLTKPGIIYGNVITTTAGYFFASHDYFYPKLFFAVTIGSSLIIGSACVFNNYLDRNIDKKMERTKNRALVSGLIPPGKALIYGTFLGILGFLLVGVYVNSLTLIIGAIGFIDYVLLYGFTKRYSVHGTLVGSISGATPIVAGYTAVTGSFGITALLLFLMLAVWQMPHFYAIATYRLKDYKAAGIPVLPAVHGVKETKYQILFYIIAFIATIEALAVFGSGSITFLIVMLGLSYIWLYYAVSGFNKKVNDIIWGKKMFKYSLIVILMLSLTLSLNSVLPN